MKRGRRALEKGLHAAQPGPLLHLGHQAFFDAVAQNVDEALDLGSFVDDGLCRVTASEEPPAPAHETANLDRDVALQVCMNLLIATADGARTMA